MIRSFVVRMRLLAVVAERGEGSSNEVYTLSNIRPALSKGRGSQATVGRHSGLKVRASVRYPTQGPPPFLTELVTPEPLYFKSEKSM